MGGGFEKQFFRNCVGQSAQKPIAPISVDFSSPKVMGSKKRSVSDTAFDLKSVDSVSRKAVDARKGLPPVKAFRFLWNSQQWYFLMRRPNGGSEPSEDVPLNNVRFKSAKKRKMSAANYIFLGRPASPLSTGVATFDRRRHFRPASSRPPRRSRRVPSLTDFRARVREVEVNNYE